MKKFLIFITLIYAGIILLGSCQFSQPRTMVINGKEFKKGSFGFDMAFMKSRQKPIILFSPDSLSQVLISTEFQGRVMTSSSNGLRGMSYGWMNYKTIDSDTIESHINAYGGEDRLWLGPEGGQFSIYFKKGAPFDFEHWQTPKPLDSETFELLSYSASEASFEKHFSVANYNGTEFKLKLNRTIRLLDKQNVSNLLSIEIPESVEFVAYESENKITNLNDFEWNKKTGMLSIRVQGMYSPSPGITVVLPFKQGTDVDERRILRDDYFGNIPPGRLKIDSCFIFFKCDGKFRSKIGVPPRRAIPLTAAYDEDNQILTFVNYSLVGYGLYVNSEWKIQDDPFSGDAADCYNDGPDADGSLLGPYYELESSSPAAQLKSGNSLIHFHRTFHFHGTEEKLNTILQQAMGISLDKVKASLN